MNLPIDACENGECAFALRVGYDAKCYAGNVGTGVGISRQRRCVWCINCVAVEKAFAMHAKAAELHEMNYTTQKEVER